MIKLLSSLLLVANLYGVTLSQIQESPTCRAKDFMIWQYLKSDITPAQAQEALYELSFVTSRFFYLFAKKSDDEGIQYASKCMRLPFNALATTQDDKCVALGISPYKVTKLTSKEREILLTKELDKGTKEYIRFIDKPLTYSHIKTFSPSRFLKVFTSAGQAYRHKSFNLSYPPSFINSLTSNYRFNRLVTISVTDKKLAKLQDSLLHVDINSTLKAQTHFFLALNHLNHNQKDKALLHLQKAYDTFYFRMDKDKAQFWQYLISKDEAILEKLSQSVDINIYSLYAKERKKVAIENYFTTLTCNDEAKACDIQSPFVWNDVLKEIKSTKKAKLLHLQKKYAHPNNIAISAFIRERESGYVDHNYIMPYNDSMRFYSNDDKALIYALMRQESHFIPSALSRSYALGVMQLMPFLVDILDKSFEDKITSYNDMFNPNRNIKYAYKHIQSLKRSMKNPLYIAYSYNGGMGFFKRHLKNTGAFQSGEYEPFMSMELMSNTESREYGKKVLANYIMYKHILKEDVSIVHFFDTLTPRYLRDHSQVQVSKL